MLQRLLTLPAQLTEDDDDCGGCEVEPAHSISLNVADILDALAPAGGGVRSGYDGGLLGVSSLSTKQGEPTPQQQQQAAVVVEEEEEEKGRKVGIRGNKRLVSYVQSFHSK